MDKCAVMCGTGYIIGGKAVTGSRENNAAGRPRQGGRRLGGRSFADTDRRAERESDGLIIEGKNAVQEAVESGREIDKILFASGSHKTVGHIISEARKKGIAVLETDKHKLDRMSETGAHQGIIAMCAAAPHPARISRMGKRPGRRKSLKPGKSPCPIPSTMTKNII